MRELSDSELGYISNIGSVNSEYGLLILLISSGVKPGTILSLMDETVYHRILGNVRALSLLNDIAAVKLDFGTFKQLFIYDSDKLHCNDMKNVVKASVMSTLSFGHDTATRHEHHQILGNYYGYPNCQISKYIEMYDKSLEHILLKVPGVFHLVDKVDNETLHLKEMYIYVVRKYKPEWLPLLDN